MASKVFVERVLRSLAGLQRKRDAEGLYLDIPGVGSLGTDDLTDRDPLYHLLQDPELFVVFDCRRVPLTFIDHTGDMVFLEASTVEPKVYLPYDYCIFEFEDQFLIAEQIYNTVLEKLDEDAASEQYQRMVAMSKQIEALENILGRAPPGAYREVRLYDPAAGLHYENGIGEFATDDPDLPWFYPEASDEYGRRLAGVVSLLSQKLVIDDLVPDPLPPRHERRRAAREGQTIIQGESHILTLNVPAVRYAVSRSARLGTHESPALHWRRGHWRAYHRGSEYEKQGWVRRCLVGDPSKGFVRPPEYRLTHEPLLLPHGLRLIEGGLAE